MVDLRSDTVTSPSAGMRDAMATAEVGDDVYGEDPTVNRLEARVASLLGKQAAMYVPTATMANQVAILSHTDRGDELFCDEDAHIYYYEAGAPAFLSGVMVHVLTHQEGLISPESFRRAIRPTNIHHPRPRLLTLENTHNRAGGAALHPHQLEPLTAIARDAGMAVHLDGSRLFNAAVALALKPAQLAAVADSVTICLSKGLGAPLGSVLVGSEPFIARARRYRKQLGGGMRQAGVVAAGGLYGLDHNLGRLLEDHQRARALAEGLRELTGIQVYVPPIPTNMVMVDLSDTSADVVIHDALSVGVKLGAMGAHRLRLVTHLDVDDQGVTDTLAFFRRHFHGTQGSTGSNGSHGSV